VTSYVASCLPEVGIDLLERFFEKNRQKLKEIKICHFDLQVGDNFVKFVNFKIDVSHKRPDFMRGRGEDRRQNAFVRRGD
jgi:hypothetical protein